MPDNVRLCVMPKGDDSNVMPNIVRPFVQSKVDDNIPRPKSSDYVCSPRAIMVYHTRQYSTLSMLFMGDDFLSRPTSFDSFFRTRAMMACHARRLPILFSIQLQRWQVTPDIVRLRVLPNADDVMPCSTSSDFVFIPRAMITYHACHFPTMYSVIGR